MERLPLCLRTVFFERRVSSAADAINKFDLRVERDEEDLVVGVVLGVEADPDERCFSLAELRIIEIMF